MEDTENSPLLVVFQRKGKQQHPCPRNTSSGNNKLSPQKAESAQIQQPLRELKQFSAQAHVTSSISLENKQKRIFAPKTKSANNKNSFNSVSSAGCENVVAANHGKFVKTDDTSCNLKSDESIQFCSQSHDEIIIIESSMTPAKQSDCDAAVDVQISHPKKSSEDPMSHSLGNSTIGIKSSNSSGENMDDICDNLEKLKVGDVAPSNSSVHQISGALHNPKNSPPKNHVLRGIRKLKELQSILSSDDDDYSPPPLNERLWGKKNVRSSLPRIQKKDVVPSRGCSKKNDAPSLPKYVVDPEISSFDDSDVSSLHEGKDSSDSEDFEEFLVQVKTPLTTKVRNSTYRNIEDTKFKGKTDETEDRTTSTVPSKPPKAKVQTGCKISSPVLPNRRNNLHPDPSSIKSKGIAISFSSDEDSYDNVTSPKSSAATTKSRAKGASVRHSSSKASFLASLSSNVSDSVADPMALIYRKNFKSKKEELVKELFALFNYKVFNDKLPTDMKVTWNPNLTTTAGRCCFKKVLSVPLGRTARIELAPKVVDSADRVRDTLAHEMCHAACWLVHGINGGHGNLWKYWANRVQQMFPEIPPVLTCHSYQINTKYVYKCTGCGGKIGRHSKSIDVSRKVCGKCKSPFELFVNGKSAQKPATPTGFALFVKQNYGNVKKRRNSLKHGDIMRLLGAEFSSKAKIST